MTRINSVLGPIDTADLGFTLMHEHLYVAFAGAYRDYPELLGSNIIERIVNEQITAASDIAMSVMTVEEATDGGAFAFFDEKYDEKVKVYSIGSFSKEVCGGPHVSNTKELGSFKIMKEQSSSAGVRRIRAVLE